MPLLYHAYVYLEFLILACTIYILAPDIEDGESVMTAEYRPVEYGKDYDVVNNPDKFQLYIDGKEVEE